MNISSIISATVRVSSRTPSLLAFGVPLILAFSEVGISGGLVRSYESLDEVTTDGHTVNSAVYRCARSMFSQSPRPPTIKVGRRLVSEHQEIRFVATDTTVGKVYSITIERSGTEYTATYTVLASSSATIIATGLKAAIDALSITDMVTTVGSGALTCECDSDGEMYEYSAISPWLTVTDMTAVGDLVTELAAVTLEDPEYYGLVVADGQSEACINAVAAVVEAQVRMFVSDTINGDTLVPGTTTDVLSDLKGNEYQRTYVQFSQTPGEFAAAALLSSRLAAKPGSDTWAFKQLVGITPVVLNATQLGSLNTKRGNWYTAIKEVNNTFWGKTPSGLFADTIRGNDAMIDEIQTRVYALFSNNPKVAYTDAGIAQVTGEVKSAMQKYSRAPYNFVDGATIVVTAPRASAVSTLDKTNRTLNDVAFSATLQGAIHNVATSGVLSS